jgi:RNA polymerase sigma factor (TIGR02999 family)
MQADGGHPQSRPADPVTRLLRQWSEGDTSVLNELTPLVYQELRRLANSYLRRERPDHTLQPTALIHEAYLRLIDQGQPEWRSRSHFFSFAAHLMRQILVDHARAHHAGKRGGSGQRVPLEHAEIFAPEREADLVALDEALTALAAFDERKARILELRFFGGMSLEETAEALGVSVRTIDREMRMARAWLYQALMTPP